MIILLFIFSIFNYFTVVEFLCQGIHYIPSSRHGVVVTDTVVVPVEAVGAVQLLSYELLGLQAGVAAVAHERAIGVVVVHLLHVSVGVGHYAVVA